MIRVQETLHAFDVAEVLANQPLPRGRRVAILGAAVRVSSRPDACASSWAGSARNWTAKHQEPYGRIASGTHQTEQSHRFCRSFRTSVEEAAVVEKLLSRDYIDWRDFQRSINPAAWSAMLGHIGMRSPFSIITKTPSKVQIIFLLYPQNMASQSSLLAFAGLPTT